MPRFQFDAIFRRHPDGSIEPLQRIRVGGIEISPGVRFPHGVAFGGIDFTQFTDHALEVETEGDTIIIKGIY